MAGIFRATERHGPERITTGKRTLGLVPVTVHCYRIGSTLIDGGAPNRSRRLLAHLSGHTISHVLLTHHHEDHIGVAGPLAERGSSVHAPEGTLPWLAAGITVPLYRAYTWGRPEPVQAQALDQKVTTPDASFEVVATPGHSPEHVAFFEPERGWLFSGDAHLGKRETLRSKERLDAYAASLVRMRALDADRLFPGHGPAVHRPDDALAEAITYFEALREEAVALHHRGRSVGGIQRDLLGWEGFMRYFTQGDFRKRHLIEQLLAWSPETSRGGQQTTGADEGAGS